MTDQKWQETLEKIRTSFEVEEEFDGEIENIPNATFQGVVFDSPMGRMKIVRSRRPRVLDKKTTYAGRAGGETKVDYVYSDTDFVDNLEISKWNELTNDWQEADLEL